MASDSEKKRFYDVLGLNPDASQDAIRSAYKQLVLKWHPDRNQNDKEHAQQKFVEIKEAYVALLEEGKRQVRSKSSKAKASPSPPAPTAVPSSTPSEYGSDLPTPGAFQKSRNKLNRRGARWTRDHYAPQAPTASTSSSSSSQSESNAAQFQPHLSYLRIERDTSTEPFSQYHDEKQISGGLDDDDYELVDLVDLGAPLLPLRIPIDSLAKDWIFPLPLTLEDLYHSALQRYRITRALNSGQTQVVKIDIRVSPNWRTGARMRVPAAGNQRQDGSFQDIVFVVKEIPHSRFTRVGNDLLLSVNIPWADASSAPYASTPAISRTGHNPLRDQEVYVRALNGEEFVLLIPRSLVEGADGTRIVGGGMPVQKNGKSIGKGDLLVKWVFTFTDSGKVQKLSPWTSFRRAMIWRT